MIRIFIIVCLAFLSFSSYAQDYFNQKKNQHKNNLVIVHPNRSNMERYAFLIKNKILNPGRNKIVGLYFEEENYDYRQVINDFPEFGFHMIPKGLNPTMLYEENASTEEFMKVFRHSKGMIFNGGPDIPPSTYKEQTSIITRADDPYRNFYEISLIFHLVGGSQNIDFKPFLKSRPKYMILGICLGMQSLNVASGGTLIQDIPSEIYDFTTIEAILNSDKNIQHRNYFSDYGIYPEIRSYNLHEIEILNGRWLDEEINSLNKNPYVFSSHHQAIGEIGQDFRSTATSIDGKIIEGIEHVKYPNVIGIQFHPEVDYLYKNDALYKFRPEDENFSLLNKINELNSYEFHIKFWNAISKRIK